MSETQTITDTTNVDDDGKGPIDDQARLEAKAKNDNAGVADNAGVFDNDDDMDDVALRVTRRIKRRIKARRKNKGKASKGNASKSRNNKGKVSKGKTSKPAHKLPASKPLTWEQFFLNQKRRNKADVWGEEIKLPTFLQPKKRKSTIDKKPKHRTANEIVKYALKHFGGPVDPWDEDEDDSSDEEFDFDDFDKAFPENGDDKSGLDNKHAAGSPANVDKSGLDNKHAAGAPANVDDDVDDSDTGTNADEDERLEMKIVQDLTTNPKAVNHDDLVFVTMRQGNIEDWFGNKLSVLNNPDADAEDVKALLEGVQELGQKFEELEKSHDQKFEEAKPRNRTTRKSKEDYKKELDKIKVRHEQAKKLSAIVNQRLEQLKKKPEKFKAEDVRQPRGEKKKKETKEKTQTQIERDETEEKDENSSDTEEDSSDTEEEKEAKEIKVPSFDAMVGIAKNAITNITADTKNPDAWVIVNKKTGMVKLLDHNRFNQKILSDGDVGSIVHGTVSRAIRVNKKTIPEKIKKMLNTKYKSRVVGITYTEFLKGIDDDEREELLSGIA